MEVKNEDLKFLHMFIHAVGGKGSEALMIKENFKEAEKIIDKYYDGD